jgi:hypothetical protein
LRRAIALRPKIEQILASHPRVFGAGELPNLSEAVVDVARVAGSMFPDAMAQMSAGDLRRLGARYVSEIAQLAPGAMHTNKMPSNFFFAGLIHAALPNARIIHAVRDPLDTCVSCFSKLFAFSQHQTYDLGELGRYYRRYQALMEHWHRLLPPGRILDVRYEDVVADLEGQAALCLIAGSNGIGAALPSTRPRGPCARRVPRRYAGRCTGAPWGEPNSTRRFCGP